MREDYKHIYDECKEHMHAYVLVQTTDGNEFDGIITGVDKEYVYFAVPNDNQMETRAEDGSDRQFWFGNPGYFGGPMWGYPGYFAPQRRFRRVILPLAALTAISLLPWY
ncbi:hypothetical protein ACFFIS_12590 [Virgibacillus soli]|uniref:hypothetical protein n=1 Tax=Paracerasibacillus soli TaxID=480284 RepID=UPI0035EC0C50